QQQGHSRKHGFIGEVEAFETEQSGHRANPVMVDAALVILAGNRRDFVQKVVKAESADQTESFGIGFGSQKIGGINAPAARFLVSLKDHGINPALPEAK